MLVTVLGLGTMGHGIAQSFALSGHTVFAFDNVAAARNSAIDRIRDNLSREVTAGLLEATAVEPAIERISIFDDESQAVDGAEFVTEAVAEDLALKQELFPRLEETVSDACVLASNTSTWPMSQISVHMRRPERALNTHWFNPPHIVPLVEVVPGEKTSPDVVTSTVELLRGIGKQAVPLRKEVPGFLINRIQIAMYREVLDLWEQGVASPEEIDEAFRASVGFRSAAIGPLQVYDFAGVDISSRCYSELVQDIRSSRDVHDSIQALVDGGHFGVKTGKGVYDYDDGRDAEVLSERDRRYLEILKLFYPRSSTS